MPKIAIKLDKEFNGLRHLGRMAVDAPCDVHLVIGLAYTQNLNVSPRSGKADPGLVIEHLEKVRPQDAKTAASMFALAAAERYSGGLDNTDLRAALSEAFGVGSRIDPETGNIVQPGSEEQKNAFAELRVVRGGASADPLVVDEDGVIVDFSDGEAEAAAAANEESEQQEQKLVIPDVEVVAAVARKVIQLEYFDFEVLSRLVSTAVARDTPVSDELVDSVAAALEFFGVSTNLEEETQLWVVDASEQHVEEYVQAIRENYAEFVRTASGKPLASDGVDLKAASEADADQVLDEMLSDIVEIRTVQPVDSDGSDDDGPNGDAA